MAGCPLSEVCFRLEVVNSKQMVDVLLMPEMRTFVSLGVQNIHCQRKVSGDLEAFRLKTILSGGSTRKPTLVLCLFSPAPPLTPSFLHTKVHKKTTIDAAADDEDKVEWLSWGRVLMLVESL